MAKNYRLPEVIWLKELGFKFEFNTLKAVFPYIKNFVTQNRSAVSQGVFQKSEKELNDYIDDDTYPSEFPDVISIVPRLARLQNGMIEKSDYFFVVHPKFKDDPTILHNNWFRKLSKYAIDLKIILFDPSYLSLTKSEAIDLVLYNEVLRWIIRTLPVDNFTYTENPLKDITDEISSLTYKIGNLLERQLRTPTNGRTLVNFYKTKLEMLQAKKWHQMFNGNENREMKASRLYYKVKFISSPTGINQTTSISEKEAVVRFFLSSQSHDVIKSKNTRGRGILPKKRALIQQYISDNPLQNDSEIARNLGVNRKTVGKYR